MWCCSVVEKKFVEIFPPLFAFHMSQMNHFSERFHKTLCFLRPKWSYSAVFDSILMHVLFDFFTCEKILSNFGMIQLADVE